MFDSRIGSSLRVFRQQLIAWASVGHSAAALEAGARGVEVLPFGVLSQTSDPWPEYSSDSMDSHPMLLELKRTMTGASGHYEVLKSTIASCFSPEQAAELPRSIVGSLLSDILDGRSWVETLAKSTGEGPGRLWSKLSCLLSAMPYHVSRDCLNPTAVRGQSHGCLHVGLFRWRQQRKFCSKHSSYASGSSTIHCRDFSAPGNERELGIGNH